jgi:hypothetical protein
MTSVGAPSGRTAIRNKRTPVPGIMDLIWPGAFVVQSIHVIARLGIADFLGPEPRTVDELAEKAH